MITALSRRTKLQYLTLLKRKNILIGRCENDTSSVIINSFPKSGTHLLLQIIEPFPKLKNYGFFIASTPSRPHKVRNEEKHYQLISNIIPGELVTGHLFYSEKYAKLLTEKDVIQNFVYRDLRDVVVSEVFYLTYMNKWHHLHSFFAHQLQNDHERIKAAITGIESNDFYYPDICSRWKNYSGWLNNDQVFSVKYEGLISENKTEIIRNMIGYYQQKTSLVINENKVLKDCLNAINPEKSHTFREGGSANWKKHFTQEHKILFKEIAGELLIELGYEVDLDW